jgi:hypothetical protein
MTEVFPCFFLSCKTNVREKLAKTGHGPHSSTLVVICVVRLFFFFSMYCLCVNVYCHRATNQFQLINISYHINTVQVTAQEAGDKHSVTSTGYKCVCFSLAKLRYNFQGELLPNLSNLYDAGNHFLALSTFISSST